MSNTEAVVAVLTVGMVIGLPMFAFVLRFALKPVIDAYVALKQTPQRSDEVDALKMRVAALEAVWQRRLGGGTLDAAKPGVMPVDRIPS